MQSLAIAVAGNDDETVSQVMSKTVFSLTPRSPVSAALETMIKHDVGCVVLIDGTNLVGIVTERDIVKGIGASNTFASDTLLGSVASKPVVTIQSKTVVWEAFMLMLKNKIRRLPVVDKGRLVGIVTERDLFKWVVKVVYEPNIPTEIKALLAQSK